MAKHSKTRTASVRRPKRPVCILVLGMHRSGTSVLAGVLGLLGASLPKNLMPPDTSNPKGYFESSAIVDLHDEMLAALGSSWLDFRRLDPTIFDSMPAAAFKERLLTALRNEYGDAPTFVVKDPRICRFVPLWRSIIESLGAEMRVVIMIRNPAEVVRSLAQRDELPPRYSSYLWLRHVLDAEFETRHCKRVFVTYSGFMRDWMKVIKEIEDKLDIALSEPTPKLEAEVRAFVDDELRHHTADEETIAHEYRDNPLVLGAHQAREVLVERSDDPKVMNVLDQIRNSFDAETGAFGSGLGADLLSAQTKLYFAQLKTAHLQRQVNEFSPLREEFEKFQSHVVKLEEILAENENEIGYLNARVNEVSALQDEPASTQTRLLELEAIVADKLLQIETLRDMHEADQKRIARFGAVIETLWANEFRQKNELCQLEQQVAQLKIEREKLASELDTIKEGLGWRIRRRLGLLITKSP